MHRRLGIDVAQVVLDQGGLGVRLDLGGIYRGDGRRAFAAAITSLMTGTSYRRSAELAGIVGPYEGYARNAEALDISKNIILPELSFGVPSPVLTGHRGGYSPRSQGFPRPNNGGQRAHRAWKTRRASGRM